MRSLNDFLEVMNHEIKNTSITLNKHGYRLDGNDGIKLVCDIRDTNKNHPKSCDYFFENSQKESICVEFSDFLTQQQHDKTTIDSIHAKVDNLTKSAKSKLNRAFGIMPIISELEDKIRDTDYILRRLYDEKLLENMPLEKSFKSCLAVWHEASEHKQPINVARQLNDKLMLLKGNLSKSNLRYLSAKDIHFLTLKDFKEKYDN